MKLKKLWVKLFAISMLISSFYITAGAQTLVNELVCEYHTNPIGIDVLKPRLSWKIVSDKQNVLQSAYEIKVTDQSPKGKVVWNSGKITSDKSVNIEYAGPELKPMQRVYWQVRVWDNDDKATKWSEPAFWEMGITKSELWTASWITMENEKVFDGSKPAHYLRKEFSTSKKIKSARVYVSALGLYELYINGKKSGRRIVYSRLDQL